MRKLVSYVLPIYNESDNIDLLHKTLTTVTKDRANYDFRFIYINDGSRDNSLDKLYKLQASDDRVIVINFARNFGHQMAVTAGLDYAEGDAIIIMDTDLQDPPRVSLELMDKWEEGYDVVFAQRRTRKDSYFKKTTASLYYSLLSKLAEIEIPANTGDFRLVDRRVVEIIKKFREHNRFMRGLVSYVGFKQTAVLFDRDERHAGETGYPLKKMLKFAADGIFSFSAFPLKFVNRVGYTISILSFLGILYALAIKIFDPKAAVSGWTFTVIAVLLVGGIEVIMLGFLGSYIGRIYTETQNRPLYIIESIKSKSAKSK